MWSDLKSTPDLPFNSKTAFHFLNLTEKKINKPLNASPPLSKKNTPNNYRTWSMKTKNHVIVTCKIHYTEQKYIAMIVSIIKTKENLNSKVNYGLFVQSLLFHMIFYSPFSIIDFLDSLIFMEWKIPYFIFTGNFVHQIFFQGLGWWPITQKRNAL